MTTTPNTTRKLAAGVAAVVLTLSAAGAAVAVNLTDSAVDSPAGKLTATEPVSISESAPTATPSTIYVDITVPVPQDPAGSATQQQSTTPPAAPAAGPVTTAASSAPSYDDDHDDGSDDHSESDDHGGDHDDGADDDD